MKIQKLLSLIIFAGLLFNSLLGKPKDEKIQGDFLPFDQTKIINLGRENVRNMEKEILDYYMENYTTLTKKSLDSSFPLPWRYTVYEKSESLPIKAKVFAGFGESLGTYQILANFNETKKYVLRLFPKQLPLSFPFVDVIPCIEIDIPDNIPPGFGVVQLGNRPKYSLVEVPKDAASLDFVILGDFSSNNLALKFHESKINSIFDCLINGTDIASEEDIEFTIEDFDMGPSVLPSTEFIHYSKAGDSRSLKLINSSYPSEFVLHNKQYDCAQYAANNFVLTLRNKASNCCIAKILVSREAEIYDSKGENVIKLTDSADFSNAEGDGSVKSCPANSPCLKVLTCAKEDPCDEGSWFEGSPFSGSEQISSWISSLY